MSISKAVKMIAFTAQAHEHHTSIKIKNVLKWLKSGHEVRVRISGKSDRQKAMEAIYNQLQSDIKFGAKFQHKVVKPDSIKVILFPTKEATDLVIEDSKLQPSVEEKLNEVLGDKDIFSDEFDQELSKSIKDERQKNKK